MTNFAMHANTHTEKKRPANGILNQSAQTQQNECGPISKAYKTTRHNNQTTNFKPKPSVTNSNNSSQTEIPTFQKDHTQTYQQYLTLPSQQWE